MLWIKNTGVITFRIDKSDWDRFVAALQADRYGNAKPSQKVRDLVLRWTSEQEQLAAAPPAPSSPAPAAKTKVKKKPAPKKKSSSRG